MHYCGTLRCLPASHVAPSHAAIHASSPLALESWNPLAMKCVLRTTVLAAAPTPAVRTREA